MLLTEALLFRAGTACLETLLEKSKAGTLTPKEATEWAGITGLSQIFTFINAELATTAQWGPMQPVN